MATIIQTKIPDGQKKIIKACIDNLENQIALLEKLNTQINDNSFLRYDLSVLKALLDYDIIVQLSPEQKENFVFKEGIDFPTWTE